VAVHLADQLRVDAATQEERGRGVAQVMDAHFGRTHSQQRMRRQGGQHGDMMRVGPSASSAMQCHMVEGD